jgi:hypothetical protein
MLRREYLLPMTVSPLTDLLKTALDDELWSRGGREFGGSVGVVEHL